MNCQSFEENVNELGRGQILDQTMESSLPERVLVHLDECSACALRLQDGRALTQRLDELAREMSSLTAPEGVEAQLRKAFRESLAGSASTAHSASGPAASSPGRIRHLNHSNHRARWNRWVLAAAAVLLIVLGIAGLRLRAGRQSQPEPVRAEVAGTASWETPRAIDGGTTAIPSKPNKKFTPNVKRTNFPRRTTTAFNGNGKTGQQPTTETTTAVANNSNSEVATQFMPIGYAGPINLQDGGQLVRVELPRSAMLSMGLPVNMDRYSERVKADVFLGVDGVARAIRFVQ
jgi:hypothetical protein